MQILQSLVNKHHHILETSAQGHWHEAPIFLTECFPIFLPLLLLYPQELELGMGQAHAY